MRSGLRSLSGDFDLIVAMYHDQGHGPVRVLGIEAGVNITVGLPEIRTSVDHGTAFDSAGRPGHRRRAVDVGSAAAGGRTVGAPGLITAAGASGSLTSPRASGGARVAPNAFLPRIGDPAGQPGLADADVNQVDRRHQALVATVQGAIHDNADARSAHLGVSVVTASSRVADCAKRASSRRT